MSVLATATARFGERAAFRVGRAESGAWPRDLQFDVVLMFGLIHHLGDAEVGAMLTAVSANMGSATRVVTLDGCFDDRQSKIAKLMIKMDRGRNVRTESQYRSLFEQHFVSVRSFVRHDLLTIPYTHCILECCKTPDASSGLNAG